jgi:hypothetical protein
MHNFKALFIALLNSRFFILGIALVAGFIAGS